MSIQTISYLIKALGDMPSNMKREMLPFTYHSLPKLLPFLLVFTYPIYLLM